MRYTGIQPQYFPRLHYFARIINTDIFVIRDEVQFVARHKYPNGKSGFSYQADSPIKQASGEYILHVPIQHAGLQSINKTEIAYTENWAAKHLQTIKFIYGRAPNFGSVYPILAMILDKKYNSIADLTITTILFGILAVTEEKALTPDTLTIPHVENLLANHPSIRLKKIKLGSDIKALKNPDLDKNQKIIATIKEVGANEDYCGDTAFTAYMDKKMFEDSGIKVVVQNWKCREYPQLFVKQQGFIPNLSIIDLLMNVPPKDALQILQEKS